MYFGTSTACVVAPSREGASPLPFGPQNKKLGNRCHNFILEILRPCAPYMAAIVTLFWGFWLFWLTFLLRQLQRVGNSKAKHWRWTTRGMSRNLCLFETPLQILYIHTFTEDLEGFPVSKKKKNLRPLYRWPFAWRIKISHFFKHLTTPLLHVLLHRQ